MKKFLAVLFALLLIVSGCGKVNKAGDAKPVTEEDMFLAIEGEYIRSDDLREFNKTKSTTGAFSSICFIRIEKTEQGRKVLIGDGHQGVALGFIKTVTKSESGAYTFEAMADENNFIKGEFLPEQGILKCTLKTSYANGGECTAEYTRYNSLAEIEENLSDVLFKEFPAITKEGTIYYAQIGDNKYSLKVHSDSIEPAIKAPHMGSLMLEHDGKKEVCFYVYEGGKLNLFNYEGLQFKTF